ncbi:MAG TPA: carboxypeptidase-like regulatory domain-containing protein [Thermoanaerobaculia bacterium]|jgi:hypothetical protein|nr:carboxypeptidase-like regulatory domain-containing protein [Thermoanaerobaculia bacterium]
MMPLLLAALVTVSGVVQYEDGSLPGVTVTLRRDTVSRTAVTNENGRYTFQNVEPGSYDARMELPSFQTAELRVTADGTELPPQTLTLAEIAESITIACGSPCRDDPPTTQYDFPLCSEQELNTTFMDAAQQGDASAIALLRARFATTLSLMERHRIARTILGHTPEDGPVFDELLARARKVLQPIDVEERDDEWNAAYDAFSTIAYDPRALPLVVRALEMNDEMIVGQAIAGLAEQHHTAALPAIEAALRRFDYAEWMLDALAHFHSPDADAIALKHLTGDGREEYLRLRDEQK